MVLRECLWLFIRRERSIVFKERRNLPPTRDMREEPVISVFSRFARSQCSLPAIVSSSGFRRAVKVALAPAKRNTSFLYRFFRSYQVTMFVCGYEVCLFARFYTGLLGHSYLQGGVTVVS